MIQPFASGKIPPGLLAEAAQAAALRGVPIARILHAEYRLPREALLEALCGYYGCPAIQYDERLPIPPELLSGLQGDRLAKRGWFPVIKSDDGTVVIAAADPADPALLGEVRECLGEGRYELRVALPDDIGWFIQEFLHAKVGKLIGTERTGLAFWRNTMAQWRTRLACYRTDMAKARTALAFLRAGLSLITIARVLMSSNRFPFPHLLSYAATGVGFLAILGALPIYLRVRKSRLTPPRHQTLVEVTAATLLFLENYHNLDGVAEERRTKETMLARLGDFLANYST
ncbi:MAG: DUF202 domain-containing protein, partial [Desulfobacteraceae bacterium]|nr:DUF202 domain-containing protein [Desulfobacteraceae bacterium]